MDRPSLRHRLDVGVRAPLTLLVAPAGAGKTVLLAQWVQSRPDLAIAWFDAGPSDDDPVRFAKRLVDGLRGVDPRLGKLGGLLGEPGGGLGAAMIEALAAAFGDMEREVVVIFDDLHNFTNRAIVEDLWRLADRLPAHAHLIFSSRVDLGLAWSRHRLEHELVEIRQADLAFDEGDTEAILEQIAGGPVADGVASAVMHHTEGWVAGIQLAGLTMRFRGDAGSLVETLEETDRLVVDFLSHEVVDAQTPERRQALLSLSVLDTMNAELVQVLTDVAEGEELLTALERESMFVVPLPGKRGWYRFHPLFRDLLRYRLRATDASAEGRLLRAAADWLVAAGEPSAAIEYLLRARRWGDAIELILQRGSEVYETGRTATVARWLSMVPRDVRLRRPSVEVLYGVMAGMTGRSGEAAEVLRSLLSDPSLDDGLRLIASCYSAAGVQFRPHPELYLEEALRGVDLLEAQPDTPIPDLLGLTSRDLLMTVALVSAGRAHLFLGQVRPAREVIVKALESAGGRYPPYRIHGLGSLALAEAWAGNLRAAVEHADEALELAREATLLTHQSTADAYLARAIVAIQRGQPETGAIALHEGTLRAAANQRTQLMWVAHLASKLIDPSSTDLASVEPSGIAPPIVRSGLVTLASQLARFAGQPRSVEPQQEWSALAFEEVASLLVRGEETRARERLDQHGSEPDLGAPGAMVDYLILDGWLAAAEGHGAAAREALNAALALAEPEWLIHPFVRAGGAVARLIDAIPGPPTRFRRAVVLRSKNVGRPSENEIIEPLTSREMEILAYLPTRLTNVEIASRCYISVNTIKTHMAHIYRKLGVTGRTPAVERARELGLIDTADAVFVH